MLAMVGILSEYAHLLEKPLEVTLQLSPLKKKNWLRSEGIYWEEAETERAYTLKETRAVL